MNQLKMQIIFIDVNSQSRDLRFQNFFRRIKKGQK